MLEKQQMELPERWSATRKSEIVLRLLRGEDLGELSREIQVPPPEIEPWREDFLNGAEAGLKKRAGDPLEREITRTRAKLGETMSGITDLKVLLASMRPVLSDDAFVFCTLLGARYGAGAEYEPVACFAEAEGLTLVLRRDRAEAARLPYAGVFRMLTLRVHSSLEAVGLTAAVAGCLATRGISANVIAAYYHDHILIPAARAKEALEALQALAETAAAETPAAE